MKNADKKALVDWLDERLKIVTTLNSRKMNFFTGAPVRLSKKWVIG